MTENHVTHPGRLALVPPLNDLEVLADDSDRLVMLALADEDILRDVRDTRKIVAIRRLRTIGMVQQYGTRVWPSLLAAKAVIECDEVTTAANAIVMVMAPRPAVEVHIVKDIGGERLEVFSWKPDAEERVRVLNIEEGQGYAFYDSHVLLARGQQPQN